jgi:hypothetical protein
MSSMRVSSTSMPEARQAARTVARAKGRGRGGGAGGGVAIGGGVAVGVGVRGGVGVGVDVEAVAAAQRAAFEAAEGGDEERAAGAEDARDGESAAKRDVPRTRRAARVEADRGVARDVDRAAVVRREARGGAAGD